IAFACVVDDPIGPGDLDAPSLERDVLVSRRLLDFDALLLLLVLFGRRLRRAVRAHVAPRLELARVGLFDQALECIELRLAAAAANLSMRDSQDLAGHAEGGLTAGTLGQHAWINMLESRGVDGRRGVPSHREASRERYQTTAHSSLLPP